MNTHRNQSPCGDISLLLTGGLPTSGAALEALARRGRCLRSAALFEAAKAVAASVRSGIGSAARALWQRRQRRAAIAELSRLDDRLLADIGIERGQIPSVVEGMLEAQSAAGAGSHRANRLSAQGQTHAQAVASIPSVVDCGPAINDDDCRPLAA